MATLQQLEAALQANIQAAVAGLTVNDIPLNITLGIGWPAEKLLQNNVRGASAVISIYDKKMARNTRRWNNLALSTAQIAAGIESSVSQGTISPSGTSVITITGAVVSGDAISAVIGNKLTENGGVVYVTNSSDTPSTIATALAVAINASPILSAWISASATGAQIMLTNLLTNPVVLSSYTGNNGSGTFEIGRRERTMQIVIWSPTQDIRQVITETIELTLQRLETFFNLVLADGSYARVINQNDFDLEDATLADTYRHDFIITVDYPITAVDTLYSVLAPIEQFSVES